MDTIAVATVMDEGAALVMVEALADSGITAEIVRIAPSTHLGRPLSFEVRVPVDRAGDACGLLDHVASEMPLSLGSEWNHTDSPEPPVDVRERQAPSAARNEPAPPRLWIGVPISLIVPFPVGLWYARFLRSQYLLLGTAVSAFGAFMVTRNRVALALAFVAKAIDIGVTPIAVVIRNRRMGGNESLRRGAALSALMTLCALLLAGFAYSQQREAELERKAAHMLLEELQNVDARFYRAPSDQLPDFPDIPFGRMCRRLLEFKLAQGRREFSMMTEYRAERERWEQASAFEMTQSWREARKERASAIRKLAQEDGQAYDDLREEFDPYAKYDTQTQEMVEALDPVHPVNLALLEALDALKDICDVWKERADMPASGDEAWARKNGRLREKERDLEEKLEERLRRTGRR